jgi:hypothetical protein
MGDTMRTTFKVFAYAVALACASITASQVNAADDADARVANQAAADVPSTSDNADTAFRKLDRGAKGYVTYDDVASLPEFSTAFGNADSSHLGRLNLAGFTQAWTAYAKDRH